MLGSGAKTVLGSVLISAILFVGRESAILRSSLPPASSSDRTTASNNYDDTRIQFLQGNSSSSSNHHPAVQAVRNRYEAYRAVGDADRWRFRGLGYLYMEHNMVLEATLSQQQQQQVLRIENVLPITQQQQQQQQPNGWCDRLTLWARVQGPELLAGKPAAVHNASHCWWEFPVALAKSGTYEIEVKLLTWNGQASIIGHPDNTNIKSIEEVQCPVSAGGTEELVDTEANHSTIRAFKLYQPVHGCCEFCTRQYPHCIAWATPPARLNATFFNNGCEFYYTPDAPTMPLSKHVGRRKLAGSVPQFHGTPHTNPDPAYFMGCGWSAWFTLDFPCLSGDLDDRVHVETPQFHYTASDTNAQRGLLSANNEEQLPLCTLEHERLSEGPSSPPSGRWVRRPFPNETECPMPMLADEEFKTRFMIMPFDPERPECWHRDDFSLIGQQCLEMNCRLIPPHSIWKSQLHNETHVYVVWKPYACDYIELTDAELQTCVDTQQLGAIERHGASVSEFLNEYLQQRLHNIRMVDGGRTITLSTLALLHKIGVPDSDFLDHEDFSILNNTEQKDDVFWVSGYFLSSERAVHGHVDRMEWSNRKVAERFPDSQMLNAFDLSAAFTYDTATQMDGMHIIGPPMKMIITKLLHHLCRDVVPTARRVGQGW